MFSGIVETIGRIEDITLDGTNKTFVVSSSISTELYIDQSIAHDGVCLTVVKLENGTHAVTAVEETLLKSNLGDWEVGSFINLERCITLDTRLDGHMVQGHVDATMRCLSIDNRDGSWLIQFSYDQQFDSLLVDKGSICINGTSLTLIDPEAGVLSVTIIPYTFEHTTFKHLKEQDLVNVEFDIIGKYVNRYMSKIQAKNNQ